MRYDLDRLRLMSPEERRDTLVNNRAKIDHPKWGEAARHNVQLIQSSGLKIAPERELRAGDWQLRKIEMIINNPANEAGMLDAVHRGEPPLSAVEPLIVAELKDEYRSERHDTVQAGYLVARRIDALGYDKIPGGEKRMPDGSVAKTAATFRKRQGSL